jgi:hypothetical protein
MKIGYPSRLFIAGGTIIIITFACVFGVSQFRAYSEGKYPDWINLGAPEGSYDNLQVLDAEFIEQHEDIYVINDLGEIFMSQSSDPRNWIKVEERPIFGYYYAIEECSAEYNRMALRYGSFPNNRITQCKSFVWNWETFRIETFVVITEDGEVWKWRYSPDLGRLFQYTILGLGIGAFTLTFLWIIYRYIELRKESTA